MLFGTTPAAARPINTYPWWKYTFIALIAILAILYSLPNFYPTDPVLQLSGQKGALVAVERIEDLKKAFAAAKINYKSVEQNENTWLVRFHDTDEQLRAQMEARKALGESATVALNLMPSTPAWLKAINAAPMKLGLDLSGGIHFLIEIDMKTALSKKEQGLADSFKNDLRQESIRYVSSQRGPDGGIVVKFREQADFQAAKSFLQKRNPELIFAEATSSDELLQLTATMSEAALKTARDEAVEQNLTILRNRVNELGVAEPLIQRQGPDRIVVQLPGIQDSTLARRLLIATASLEFRAGNDSVDPMAAEQGRVPGDSEALPYKGRMYVVKKHAFVTGDELTGASSGVDQNGLPSVDVRLDGKGGQKMLAHTKQNVGKPMAGVLIEYKQRYDVEGKPIPNSQYVEKKLATYATINGVFSTSFQITGLDSPAEARELAMTLRSGALTAPIRIVEERTVGPSMGKENIEKGITAMGFAMLAVMGFMLLKYRVFGLATNIALFTNLALTMAIMSMFGAVLTMPGIAGLVLGLAMSVDANVLINERIREEIRGGKTPQMAINSGYEEASGAILDSNITLLISGLVLYVIGTGSIKGFAVTMIIGNLASMFTAVAGTRAIVNAIHGGRDLKKLWI